MLSVSFLANAKYENLIQKLFHIFQGNSQEQLLSSSNGGFV